ncbi:MAG: RNA polymerase sigma factor RpoD [Tissierella sp.]
MATEKERGCGIMSNKNYNNEELVRLYKETKEQKFLTNIVEQNKKFLYFCRNYAIKSIAINEEYLDSEKEDLIQEGYVGLLEAVNKFDEDKGIKFTTYASRCIIGAMMDYLKKEIKYKARTQSLDCDISYEELDCYYVLLKYDIGNMIEDALDPLEKNVILLHYGFNRDREYTIAEINKLINIENAKYLIQKSLKKLRKTEIAKEYKKEFYREKLEDLEERNINPEIKVIKKICFEEVLQNI